MSGPESIRDKAPPPTSGGDSAGDARRRAEVQEIFSEALRNPPLPEDNPERPLALEALRREHLGELVQRDEGMTPSDVWHEVRDRLDLPMQTHDLATVMDMAEGALFGGGVGVIVREAVEQATGLAFDRAEFGPGQMAGLFTRDLALSVNPYTLAATLFADGTDGGFTAWNGMIEGDGWKMAEGGVQIALAAVAAKFGFGAVADDAARAVVRASDEILAVAPKTNGRYLIEMRGVTRVVPKIGEVLPPNVWQNAQTFIDELPETLGALRRSGQATAATKDFVDRLADQMAALARGLSPEHPMHREAMQKATSLRAMTAKDDGMILLNTKYVEALPDFMGQLAEKAGEAAKHAPRIDELLKAAD